jgi:hypothetical protein
MIVVVEGISASGKSTWCARHGGSHVVPENGTIAGAPDRVADPTGAAAFWGPVRGWLKSYAKPGDRPHWDPNGNAHGVSLAVPNWEGSSTMKVVAGPRCAKTIPPVASRYIAAEDHWIWIVGS